MFQKQHCSLARPTLKHKRGSSKRRGTPSSLFCSHSSSTCSVAFQKYVSILTCSFSTRWTLTRFNLISRRQSTFTTVHFAITLSANSSSTWCSTSTCFPTWPTFSPIYCSTQLSKMHVKQFLKIEYILKHFKNAFLFLILKCHN